MGLIITLSIVGIILIIAELILIPGIFITGLLGLLSMGAACFLAFDNFGDTAGLITVVANILLAAVCVVLTLRSRTWRKLSLHTEIDSKADSLPEEKGISEGTEGVTITRLNPMGKVLFGDQTVECTVRNGIIDPGQTVVVHLIEDNKIYVKLK